MKNLILMSIAVLSGLGVSATAQAQAVCSELFQPSGVEINVSDYSYEKQVNPAALDSITFNLLKMTSYSRSSFFNEKNVVEKGELVLASPLKDGWSVEFEYAADYRGSSPVFRLKEIDLIKPNGEVTTLDKAPTNLTGDTLKKEFYPIDPIDSHMIDAQINMPVTIYSPVFENMGRWAVFAEFIKRGELQALKEIRELKVLRGKVAARSAIDYTKKVIKKQSFKYFLLGAVMYFYSQRDVIKNEIIVVDTWDKMKAQSDVALSNDKMRAEISDLLSKMTQSKVMVPRVFEAPLQFDYSEFSAALKDIDVLNRLERTEVSKPIMALWDGSKFNLMSAKKININIFDSVEDDAALVIYFPATSRIVIVSSKWMSYTPSTDLVLPFLLEPGSDIQGNVFNILKEKIKTLKKDSK